MARTYAGNGSDTLHATDDSTLINLHATTTVRPGISQFCISCGATPADSAAVFVAQRTTTKGTGGTEVTSVKALDPGSPVSLGTYTPGTFSAEPTYTAGELLFRAGMSQRNPLWWYANGPRFYMRAPATANNGIGIYSQESNSGTATHYCSVWWDEGE